MAVAVEMDFSGATLEQYDQVLEKMGLTPGGAGPPGAISHWVTKTDDGIRVTDVWESKEQYGQFAEEQIGPYAKEVGFPGEPQIRFYEVHNYFTPVRDRRESGRSRARTHRPLAPSTNVRRVGLLPRHRS